MICAYIVLVLILAYLLGLDCLKSDGKIDVMDALLILIFAIVSPLGIGYLVQEGSVLNKVLNFKLIEGKKDGD